VEVRPVGVGLGFGDAAPTHHAKGRQKEESSDEINPSIESIAASKSWKKGSRSEKREKRQSLGMNQ